MGTKKLTKKDVKRFDVRDVNNEAVRKWKVMLAMKGVKANQLLEEIIEDFYKKMIKEL